MNIEKRNPNPNRSTERRSTGRARHSVRAVVGLVTPGAHGVTRPTLSSR